MGTTILNLVILAVFLFILYLILHRLFPWVVVRLGRKAGFKMKMTPIWLKRIKRFKTLKRGYYSFIIITTLFFASFFAELVINDKPLFISYKGKVAMPAFREWFNTVLIFPNTPTYLKKSDFGQVGDEQVEYRQFESWCRDPELVLTAVKPLEKELAELKLDLKDLEGELSDLEEEKEGLDPEEDEDDISFVNESIADAKEDIKDTQYFIKSVTEEIEKVKTNYKTFKDGEASILMPMYPFSPYEHVLDIYKLRQLSGEDVKPPDKDTKLTISQIKDQRPPFSPNRSLLLGTDDAGIDVLASLVYGFRISLAFAIVVATIGYTVGVIVGGVMGYFGGWTDILVQRFIEIWGSIPFLFSIMIIASVISPTFLLLALLMILLRSWMGITYTIRGEFYREKAKDYVQAAIGIGQSDWKVMTRHILPNSLVPVVTFAPFGIVAYIGSLVSLDYLGFGLPVGTPSWGALLRQGQTHIMHYPHLIIVPALANALTLFAVVMIGEAVREAFDPKVFSRLR